MDQQQDNRGIPPGSNVITRSLQELKLFLVLMIDGRVPFYYKLLPVGAFLWAVLPDLIPGILDDLGIAYLAPQLFLDLCRDHRKAVYRQHYDRIYPERAVKEKKERKERLNIS